MNILTKKYYFFSVFLLLTTNNFTLIASEITKLPNDITKLILWHALEKNQTEYAIGTDNVSGYKPKIFIPCTNRSFSNNNTIARIQNTIKGLNPAIETLRVKKKINNVHYLDMQAWCSFDECERGINYRILLYIANKNIQYQFGIGDLASFTSEYLGGINNVGTAFFAQSDEKEFDIYILHPEAKYHADEFPFSTHQGLGQLWSIMLHPEKNIIIYSTIHSNPEYKADPFTIGILYISPTRKYINFAIQITSAICHALIGTPRSEQYVNFLIQKIIHIGKENYLGLTNTGKFIFLWEGINQPMDYAIQKHTSIIKDFAVDETIRTKNGFYPHIVCLDDQGNIFVGDLFKFSQPTLFWVRKMIWNPQHKPTGLFYDNGHYGILYEENKNEKNEYCDGYATLVTWPANLNLLCLGKEIGLPQAHI